MDIEKSDSAFLASEIISAMNNIEPITEDLKAELIAKGWKRESLEAAIDLGLGYSRSRDSIMGSPVFFDGWRQGSHETKTKTDLNRAKRRRRKLKRKKRSRS